MTTIALSATALAYLKLGAEQVRETEDGVQYWPQDLDVSGFEAALASAQADAFANKKAARISALTADCAAEILAGYRSAALGTPHTYPSNFTDQINMMGSVTASLLPGLPNDWSTPFWCEDAAGVWAFRAHNAAQIQQVGSDGKAHVVTCQNTLEQLSTLVLAETSVEAVDAIAWPSPEQAA